MPVSTATDPDRRREFLSATVDLESLDTIARSREGTAHVLLELRGSLLADAALWLGDTRLEFSVVDPALGTVEPRGGTVAESAWPLPLVRAVLDRVGVGLLERPRAGSRHRERHPDPTV